MGCALAVGSPVGTHVHVGSSGLVVSAHLAHRASISAHLSAEVASDHITGAPTRPEAAGVHSNTHAASHGGSHPTAVSTAVAPTGSAGPRDSWSRGEHGGTCQKCCERPAHDNLLSSIV
jgi:hypothetical protein